jgi:hypothetical protein
MPDGAAGLQNGKQTPRASTATHPKPAGQASGAAQAAPAMATGAVSTQRGEPSASTMQRAPSAQPSPVTGAQSARRSVGAQAATHAAISNVRGFVRHFIVGQSNPGV